MGVYEQLINRETKLSLIGLGYVGLPIAIEFSHMFDVIGFDVNQEKIELYKSGVDPTHEVGDEMVTASSVVFASDESLLEECSFHIVAVPTPVKPDHTPDLAPVEQASHIVGRNLKRGSIVVYESTVYPGVTEDICVPILEKESGLQCGEDFKVGYSPERINPGDKQHRLHNITKIVSGMDQDSLAEIAKVYEIIIEAGVFRAQSIKVAEAAKVIENSQRDINIAFINELSIIFDKMHLDTKAVLEAASTKWNFLNFEPGLVGGHCIGVDPYYLTYRAEQLGYHSQVILAGRQVNDGMGKYVAENCIKKLVSLSVMPVGARVAVLGLTFKENCPDIRNTRVVDIVSELDAYGAVPLVCDPLADVVEADHYYGIKLYPLDQIKNIDAVIVATAHKVFAQLTLLDFDHMFRVDGKRKLLIDVKGLFDRCLFEQAEYTYWRL